MISVRGQTKKNIYRFECLNMFFLEHYRELGLLKKSNPNLRLSIRLGGKISQYTPFLKQPSLTTQLVRSLVW